MGCTSSRNVKDVNYSPNTSLPPKDIPVSISPSGSVSSKSNISITGKDLSQITINVPNPFESHYRIKKILAKTKYVTVSIAVDSKANKYIVESTNVSIFDNRGYSEADYFNRLDILREFEHENIPQMIDFFDCTTQYNILSEYVPGNNLDHFISNHKTLEISVSFYIILFFLF
jgi:hypothetical protein